MGALLPTIHKVDAIEADDLRQRVNFGSLLVGLVTSEQYRFGFLTLIEARKNEIVDLIRRPTEKDKYGEYSIRLDELDKITEKIQEAIETGQKAEAQLETINKNQKETA